jgi:hypothetical protein
MRYTVRYVEYDSNESTVIFNAWISMNPEIGADWDLTFHNTYGATVIRIPAAKKNEPDTIFFQFKNKAAFMLFMLEWS